MFEARPETPDEDTSYQSISIRTNQVQSQQGNYSSSYQGQVPTQAYGQNIQNQSIARGRQQGNPFSPQSPQVSNFGMFGSSLPGTGAFGDLPTLGIQQTANNQSRNPQQPVQRRSPDSQQQQQVHEPQFALSNGLKKTLEGSQGAYNQAQDKANIFRVSTGSDKKSGHSGSHVNEVTNQLENTHINAPNTSYHNSQEQQQQQQSQPSDQGLSPSPQQQQAVERTVSREDLGKLRERILGPYFRTPSHREKDGRSSTSGNGQTAKPSNHTGFHLTHTDPDHPGSSSINGQSRLDSFGLQNSEVFQNRKFVIKKQDIKIKFDCPLGQGAYGQVYECNYLEQLDAIKIMPVKNSSSEDKFQPQVQELKILELIKSNADHPNIVQLYGIVITQSQVMLVMKYYSVGSLAKVLYPKKKPSTQHNLEDRIRLGYRDSLSKNIKERLLLIQGVARGICHLHDLNIIHRDLKPDNILMDWQQGRDNFRCTPVITDFGLAAVCGYNGAVSLRPGTYVYTAPENFIEGVQTVTKGADVYSFGLIGLEILQMKPPWGPIDNNAKVFNVMNSVQMGQKPAVEPQYSSDQNLQQVIQLLESCYKYYEQNRPTMASILQQLQNIIDSYPGGS